MLVPFLLVLETSEYPPCLALLKVAIFVVLDRQHPTSCDVVFDGERSCVHKVENVMLPPAFVLRLLCLRKLLGKLPEVSGCRLFPRFRSGSWRELSHGKHRHDFVHIQWAICKVRYRERGRERTHLLFILKVVPRFVRIPYHQ